MWKKTCEKKKFLIRFFIVVISEAKESERQRQRQRQRDFAVWIIHCPWLLLVEEEFLRFPPVVLDFIFSMDVVVIVACCWLQVLSRNIQLFKKKGRSFDFVTDVRRGEQPSGTAASSSSSSSRTQSFSFRSAALQLLSVVFSPNFVVFSCLAVFSVVVIISCNTILCKVSNG
jgi:hypothetical protein